jgi:hypothetical protein
MASRAYYASYQRCLQWERSLPAPGESFDAHGVHQQLIDRLENPHKSCSVEQSERSRAVASLLRRQRKLRVMADYRLNATLRGQQGKEQLRLMEAVFELCDGAK